MYFNALALLFASAALAQPKPRQNEPADIQVSFALAGQNPTFGAVENECTFFPYGNEPISDILITPLTLQDPTCVFYTGYSCEGQEWTLKQGPHHFSRPFLVGSFVCKGSE
ncbi:hypothetical protein P170DRAFT_510169 [Aspergillus steynii IBT 23096]|uniref:Uncharacterized protein n=1 Tax=Aspergillus steynii IBT 23096 TaxID=1392250 RepID=A0A2I2G9V1_9EURO|nr:uncharacterized protein P170DRAFT_510169 [Aspergillus steynii IBT 23096]PLB49645.1 hypothetical protein P170DRAFT_510169 [Aspergillus steynii IBT 23096]